MRLLYSLLLAALTIVTNHSLGVSQSPSPENLRWALAIHGGAGGNAATWDEAKKMRRLEGLQQALEIGREILAQRGAAMDAVEAVVKSLEDNPSFNAGRGAVLTTDGRAELDASIMDGNTLQCGAVGGVTRIKNPISLARIVLEHTPHVLLIGEGAEALAVKHNIPLVDPSYFLSAQFPRPDGDQANPSSDAESLVDETASRIGTVGCVALDASGNLAAGTSTGGTPKKLPGRLGDSPIIGAGTYASNDSCAVSGTGIGEEFIRHSIAYDIAAQMRYASRPIAEAVDRLFTQRLKPDVGGVIALAADGTIVMQHNTPSMSCGAADSQGRFEVMLEAH